MLKNATFGLLFQKTRKIILVNLKKVDIIEKFLRISRRKLFDKRGYVLISRLDVFVALIIGKKNCCEQAEGQVENLNHNIFKKKNRSEKLANYF